MAFNLPEKLSKGRELISSTPPTKLAIGGAILALAVAALLYLALANSSGSYENLYTKLSHENAGAIVEFLKKNNISYELTDNGTTVKVPNKILNEAKIQLAMNGLPGKGHTGYELFDQQKLGTTDFQQKINLQRAIQGELVKTILTFPQIQDASIHFTVPKDSIFIEDQKEPKASVTLTMKPGAELDKAQLMGIVNLVTSAVDGLTASNVSIIDTNGGLLWSGDQSKGVGLTEDELKQQKAYEQDLGRRLKNMLGRVVGPDKVIINVNAEMDWKEVLTEEEMFDPEKTAVRSEQRIKENSQGPGRGAAGVPNATYELGTANRQNSSSNGAQELYNRTEETTNYEISNTKKQTRSKGGEIKKISVAVSVDGTYSTNDKGEKVFTPLSADQLAKLDQLVKSTIGYDAKRGDSVSIESVEFYQPEAFSVWAMFFLDLLREFGRPLMNIILIAMFFFFVIKPLIKWLKKEVEPIGGGVEPAVLPSLPKSNTQAYSDILPFPDKSSDKTVDHYGSLALGEDLSSRFLDEPLDPLDDSQQMYKNEQPEEVQPLKLSYGSLNRDNVLPLARDNMDRTVALLKSWIDEKPTENSRKNS